MRAQYPVPWWDPALYHTLGREACNPRPTQFAAIHNILAPFTSGFISYSDGMHDDVNKVIWSACAWDTKCDVREAMVEYANVYFGSDVAEAAADGILALERNWEGPLETNGAVAATLGHWNALAEKAPHLAGNWRWQLCLLRAVYDAYVRDKRIYEHALEDECYDLLAAAPEDGADVAMDRALAVLKLAEADPARPDLRQRIVDLCEDMFQSIGFQTSVPKYSARGFERGAVLDFVDLPLNNRWWLEDEFARVGELSSEAEKLERLETIRTWENPGAGSFYDDVGNVANSPHVVRGEGMPTDPTMERTAIPHYIKFDDGFSRKRLSWQSNMHWPEALVYHDVDADASYVVRVTGHRRLVMRINGQVVEPTVNTEEIGEFRLYDVPREAVRTGSLTLTWDDVDAGNVHWREWSRINEVWLLKQ